MQAQDLMTTVVATIPADATVQEAAKLMLERRISALPVMDEKDRVVGVISEGDLMRRAELGTDDVRSWWLRALAENAARDFIRTHGTAVRDVMSAPVVSVRPTAPLQDIARLFEKHRIKRVPVLKAGRLVGIVSRADLVRRLATLPVRDARRAVDDRVLRRQVQEKVGKSGVDAVYVNITVDGGTAHLWGGVGSDVEKKALRVAAKSVTGVRKVEDHTYVMPPRIRAALGAV